jgi:transcription antitermination factor NusG
MAERTRRPGRHPPAAPPESLTEEKPKERLMVEAPNERIRAGPAVPACRRFRAGDQVTVVSGPFRWTEARFESYLTSSDRVRILLDLVHRQVAVDVDRESLV